MVSIGDPRDVADRYLELAFGREVGYEDPDVGSARMGDGAARVTRRVARRRPRRSPRGRAPVRAADAQGAREVQRRRGRSGREPDAAQRAAPAGGRGDHHRGPRGDGRLQRGRMGVFAFSFHNMLAPGRYHPIVTITHRGDGLDVIDRFAGACRSSSPAWPRAAAWSRSRCRPRSTAGASRPERGPAGRRRSVSTPALRARPSRASAVRGPGAADPRAARARRQLVALLAPRLQHRAQRIQTEVLRLGARLPVAGGAAAAAVRRALRLLRPGLPRRQGERRGGPLLRRPAARLDRAVHVLRRSHRRRGAQRRRPREPRPQDPVPAAGDPDLGRAAGAVQPRPEPGRGDDLRGRSRACTRCSAGSSCR